MNKHTFSEFALQVHFADLLPDWRVLKPMIKKDKWYSITAFMGWCSRRDIDAGAATEAHLLDFAGAFKASGQLAVEMKIERVRSIFYHARAAHPNLPLPALSAPSKRETPRQDQFDAAPPQLQADLEAVMAIAKDAKQSTRFSRRNMLLRMIKVAEATLGEGAIGDLGALFSKAGLRALKAGNWGDPEGSPDDPTSLCAHNREYTLQLGRLFFKRIKKDMKHAHFIGRVLKKYVRRRAEVPAHKVDDAAAIDGEALRTIGDKAKSAIRDFVAPDGVGGYDLERAQIALGIIVLLGTAYHTGDIMKVHFIGPDRLIPNKVALERRTLALNTDPSATLEDCFLPETVELIDKYWLAFLRRTGIPPKAILCHRDGTDKKPVTFSGGVGRFCRAHGFEATPELIRLAIVRDLYRSKAKREDIAAILGVRQLVNLDSRFSIFEGEDAAEAFSELVDNERETP